MLKFKTKLPIFPELFPERETKRHEQSKDKEPRDNRPKINMILDTKKSNFGSQ